MGGVVGFRKKGRRGFSFVEGWSLRPFYPRFEHVLLSRVNYPVCVSWMWGKGWCGGLKATQRGKCE